MNGLSLAYAVKSMRTFAVKHAPELLTGFGIAGMLTTVVMAVKATPKAVRLLDSEKANRLKNNVRDEDENIKGLIKVSDDKNGEYGHYRLPIKDTIKIAWKLYAPSAILCAVSVACLIGANSVNTKRNTALATAYALSETAIRDYRQKVIENVGDKKEDLIHTSVVQEKLDANPVSDSEVIITDAGTTLCYDVLSGRYFQSDKSKIDRAINELNRTIVRDDYASLNDFYDLIGIDQTGIGNMLGWNTNDRYVEVRFSSHLASGERPCLAISFNTAPRYDAYR